MKTFKDAVEYLPIIDRLVKRWLPYWKPKWVVPDATGMGRTNAELINSAVKSFPGTKIYTNPAMRKNKDKVKRIGFVMGDPATKKEMFDNLHDLLEHALIALPSHMKAIREGEPGFEMYQLKQELVSLQYEIKTKSVVFETASATVGTDRIIALALAVYPFKKSLKVKYVPPKLSHHGYIQDMNEPLSAMERSRGSGFAEAYNRYRYTPQRWS
jgi:hypothetical protein